MLMSLQQQQKDSESSNLLAGQRPPRSNRSMIKTSQGTRARHHNHPLLTQVENQKPTSYGQQHQLLSKQEIVASADVLAYSDPYSTAPKFSMPKAVNMYPFQQRSFNGLLNDYARKTVPRRISHQTRKRSGQVTLFHQQSYNRGGSGLHEDGADLSDQRRSSQSRERKRHPSKRSRSRSRSSQKSHGKAKHGGGTDSDCGTPSRATQKNIGGEMRRSLNFGKRARDQNAISAENMRFVAKLVNVKATVPHGMDIAQRDIQQKKLRKNLQNSSYSCNQPTNMKVFSSSNQSQHQRRSHLGTPMSNRSQDKSRLSPQLSASRLKSKGLHNLYKIKQTGDPNDQQLSIKERHSASNTPKYLRPRAFDEKKLAQMYEADDHLLFGDKFRSNQSRHRRTNNKCSDTASRASSQRSSQGSARRRKKKIRRRFAIGETGSDSAAAVFCSQGGGGIEQAISEHPGPKPNPAGQSLVQKMNNLMAQKQKRAFKGASKDTQSKGKPQAARNNVNLAEQVQQMLVSDQDNQDMGDLQSLDYREAINEQPESDDQENIKQVQSKKPFVMKLSRSNPRHHGKRKSLQDSAAPHLFVQNQVTSSQKAALLSGYYNSQMAYQKSSAKYGGTKSKRAAGHSLPPRTVKTATIRKTTAGPIDPQQTSSYDYLQQYSQKVSPTRSSHQAGSLHATYYHPRTTINASQVTSSKRRIIVAMDKKQASQITSASVPTGADDPNASCNINNYTIPMARHTDSNWNRQRNLTQIENAKLFKSGQTSAASGKPLARPGAPQSANLATNAQKSRAAMASRPQVMSSGSGQPQPVRVYQQDVIRKRFLTDKLFSPVLKSQNSSSVVASAPFDQNTIGVDSVGEPVVFGEIENNPNHNDIIQGGLRPRVMRTADGATRARIKQTTNPSNDYGQVSILESTKSEAQPEQPIAGPSVIAMDVTAKDEVIPVQKILAQNSSFEEQTRQACSAAQMATVARPQPQKLNTESADTINQIAYVHNIKEDTPSEQEAREEPQIQQSAAMLFAAPKIFNQISEEGGDSDEDEAVGKVGEEKETPTIETKKQIEGEGEDSSAVQDEQEAVLPKNYPRLL